MKARKASAIFLALLFVVNLIAPQTSMAMAKRKIAVMPFDYGAVQGGEVGTYDVGKGIVSLLITKLVNDSTYSVIDRQMLDSILKEQNFSVSDRADQATAIKIGKLLSIDCMVVGTVTQFGFENKSTSASGAVGALGYVPYGGYLGFLGGASSHKSTVKVAIDARMIDVTTGEILGSVHGTGESLRKGVSLWGGGAGFDMGSSGFASSIAGEATMQAVDQVGQQLEALANKIPDNQSLAAQNVQGKVADVTGTQVVVNVGKNNGLAAGDNLQVVRAYKTIKDPTSGKVLKELSNTIAIVKLSSVDSDNSTGNITKGSGVAVGDNVQKITTDVSAVVVNPVAGSESTTRSVSATGTVLKKNK
ncbi:MAG TPA: CsgG/HfaB family protein [Drouetiella sp.]